ncbi:hypothetical protein FQN54_000836 [Arachnomyces sp. PD_36]|nr:hypothetical protein FQN54_000836 [Arachnomyces sp. PD_36]
MISFQEALDALGPVSEELYATLDQEEEIVALEWAVDRIAKHSYHSPRPTPAYDTSALDGFAIYSGMITHASQKSPVTFCVDPNIVRPGGDCFVVSRGDIEERCGCGNPGAVEIMTGGRFPSAVGSTKGAELDCCIRREDTIEEEFPGGHRHIRIFNPVPSGKNMRLAASDFSKGDKILERGSVIRAKHIMALASVGFHEVAVLPRLRVGIWSTGDELMRSSTSECPDVNGPFLTSSLRSMGASVEFLGGIPDDSGSLTKELKAAVASGQYHVLISTGGVSAGKYDFVHSSLESLNARNIFHHVAMEPGRPVLFATIPSGLQEEPSSVPALPDIPFFGLPGNPIATTACFRFLVMPFLKPLLPTGPPPLSGHNLLDLMNSGNVEVICPPDSHQDLDVFRYGSTVISRNGSKVKVLLNLDQSPGKVKPFTESTCWIHISRGGGSGGGGASGIKQAFPL